MPKPSKVNPNQPKNFQKNPNWGRAGLMMVVTQCCSRTLFRMFRTCSGRSERSGRSGHDLVLDVFLSCSRTLFRTSRTFRTCSGTFREHFHFQNFHGTCPENYRNIPGNFPDISWKPPGNFPGHFRDISGHFQNISGHFPDHFRTCS